MAAARQAVQESAQPNKYYNRTAVPHLHVVPDQDASERFERQEKNEVRKKTASLAQTGVLVFACFLIGALSVAGYERLTEVSLNIHKVKKDIAIIEKRIDELDVQIACVTDINHVMDTATNKFAMVYPQKDQIVELDEGLAADTPIRVASVPYADTLPREDEIERFAFSKGEVEDASEETSSVQGETNDRDLVASAAGADEISASGGSIVSDVPSYAAVAVRITEDDQKAASSSNILLAKPQ